MVSQLENLNGLKREDVLIVGSVGRSAIYGSLYDRPHHEYEVRRQHPLGTIANPRDIDILGLSAEEATSYAPYPVDASGFRGKYSSLVRDRGEWYLVAEYHNFAEQLHPDVMEPVEAKGICGAIVKTVPIQTHKAIHRLDRARVKDDITAEILENAHSEIGLSEKKRDDLYGAFNELRRLNRSSTYLTARNLYRRHVPVGFRQKVVPIVRAGKKTLRICD